MNNQAQRQVPQFTKQDFFTRKTKYCVLVPVINEGKRIASQLAKMKPLAGLADIIICDGGSVDGSLAEGFVKEMNVRSLLIKQDVGKLGAQLRMGFAYALDEGYEGIIVIDGNDKDDPKSIVDFIAKLDNGFDYIGGSRFIMGGQEINTPLYRLWAIKYIHAPFISLLSRFKFTDTTNGFRAYSRRFLEDSRVNPFRDIFTSYEILFYLTVRSAYLGFKVTEVPVIRAYPKQGKTPTKINFFSGNIKIIISLLKLAGGFYNP